jgi:hypothetical protein
MLIGEKWFNKSIEKIVYWWAYNRLIIGLFIYIYWYNELEGSMNIIFKKRLLIQWIKRSIKILNKNCLL